jgi:secreted trypsin-like serine protease
VTRTCRIAALWALVWAGCDAAGPRVHQGARPLTNATAAPDDTAVVLLVATRKTGPRSLCTATAISPSVLLTAAHCIDPAELGAGVTWSVYLGADGRAPLRSRNPTLFIAVDHVVRSPAYETEAVLDGSDVGVVVLAQPLPCAIIPVGLASAPVSATGGQPVRLVGYGKPSETDLASVGVRRQATLTVRRTFPGMMVLLGGTAAQPRTACGGDSGAPVLRVRPDGIEEIIGVVSSGLVGCEGKTYASALDGHLAFIEDVLAGDIDLCSSDELLP